MLRVIHHLIVRSEQRVKEYKKIIQKKHSKLYTDPKQLLMFYKDAIRYLKKGYSIKIL